MEFSSAHLPASLTSLGDTICGLDIPASGLLDRLFGLQDAAIRLLGYRDARAFRPNGIALGLFLFEFFVGHRRLLD